MTKQETKNEIVKAIAFLTSTSTQSVMPLEQSAALAVSLITTNNAHLVANMLASHENRAYAALFNEMGVYKNDFLVQRQTNFVT